MTPPNPMAKRPKEDPKARDARLKEALRANLHRRKAQARARDDDSDDTLPPEDTA